MKTLCKAGILLTKGNVALSLVAWLLSVTLLITFLFCGDVVLLVLAALLFLSRARVCAAYAESFRRAMTNPKKPIFFLVYLFLPVAEIQYFVQGCKDIIAVRPFWLRIPLHSNTAIAEAITTASPYTATAEDHNDAIAIQTPVGTANVTISKTHLELYIFFINGECDIAEDMALPGHWKREYFSQEAEYSVECTLSFCPYSTIAELSAMIIFELNRLVFAADRGE